MTKSALIKNFRSNPRKLFLIDGLGAILTAFMLGVVFVNNQEHIGMPRNVLIILSLLACVFLVYSFTCYIKSFKNWRVLLRIIAFANLGYCCITMALLYVNFQSLTLLGLIYFIAEIIIIVGLVYMEFLVANDKK
tara:strand:+ start:245 stop:649 length:405 start_codon:yes stop_codon:yes gene_type:complete